MCWLFHFFLNLEISSNKFRRFHLKGMTFFYPQSSLLSELLSSPWFISFNCIYLFFNACYLVPTQIMYHFLFNFDLNQSFSNCMISIYNTHIQVTCHVCIKTLCTWTSYKLSMYQWVFLCFFKIQAPDCHKIWLPHTTVYRMIDTNFTTSLLYTC